MAPKWLSVAILLGWLTCGTARADVTYAFFDASNPGTVDLGFTVAEPLSHTTSLETFLTVGGVFGSDFGLGTALYTQPAPVYQPVVTFFAGDSMFFGNFVFTSFPSGDPSNGAPGDGSFSGQGSIGAWRRNGRLVGIGDRFRRAGTRDLGRVCLGFRRIGGGAPSTEGRWPR